MLVAYFAHNGIFSESSEKQWLTQNGCEGASYFIVKGFGETRPIANNELPDGRDNKEGRAQNRRVEIRYKYQK